MFSQNAKRLVLLITLLASAGCNTSPEASEARFLKRGDALVAKKDYARAILEFRNASNAGPLDAEPYYRMGLAYIELRDSTNAAIALRAATGIDPKHSRAQLKLTELMSTATDTKVLEEAVSRIETTFGPSPVEPAAIDTLALIDWKLGWPEEASQRLEKLLKKSPSHVQSSLVLARIKLSQNDPRGAEQVLKEAATAAPQSVEAALALGDLYASQSQPEKAEREFRRALELNPGSGAGLLSLGRVQIAQNRLTEAEETYKRLAALPEKEYKPFYAIFLYNTNRHDDALRELKKLVKSDPNDRYGRTLLVSAYFIMSKVTEADGVLTAALKHNPKDLDALLQRGELYLKLGRIGDSEKDLKEFLRFKSSSAEAHAALGDVYKIQGEVRKHRQESITALELAPRQPTMRLAVAESFRAAQQPKSALDVIDQAPADQKMLLPLFVERIWTLLELGNIQEAKADVDVVLGQIKAPEVVLQRSVVKLLERDYAGARNDAEEALKGNPGDIRAVSVMAEADVLEKQASRAIERFSQLAAAQPKSAPLQTLLGQWYLRADDSEKARKAFEVAKSVDSQFVPADLALAQLDLRAGRADDVRRRLGAVLAANPRNVTAMLMLAETEEGVGNRKAVVGVYRMVLDVDNTNLTALNNIAYALERDNPAEALVFARQAAELAPDSPLIQDTLGWAYYRNGFYTMAVRYLKTAMEKQPTTLNQFHLGMSYMRGGVKPAEREMGKNMVNAALQKDPDLAKTER